MTWQVRPEPPDRNNRTIIAAFRNGKRKSYSAGSITSSSTPTQKKSDFENFFEEPQVKVMLESRRESFLRHSTSAEVFPVAPPDLDVVLERSKSVLKLSACGLMTRGQRIAPGNQSHQLHEPKRMMPLLFCRFPCPPHSHFHLFLPAKTRPIRLREPSGNSFDSIFPRSRPFLIY